MPLGVEVVFFSEFYIAQVRSSRNWARGWATPRRPKGPGRCEKAEEKRLRFFGMIFVGMIWDTVNQKRGMFSSTLYKISRFGCLFEQAAFKKAWVWLTGSSVDGTSGVRHWTWAPSVQGGGDAPLIMLEDWFDASRRWRFFRHSPRILKLMYISSMGAVKHKTHHKICFGIESQFAAQNPGYHLCRAAVASGRLWGPGHGKGRRTVQATLAAASGRLPRLSCENFFRGNMFRVPGAKSPKAVRSCGQTFRTGPPGFVLSHGPKLARDSTRWVLIHQTGRSGQTTRKMGCVEREWSLLRPSPKVSFSDWLFS